MSEEVLLIFPLNNFSSDVELLKLDDRTCLRRANSNEIQKLIGSASEYRAVMRDALRSVNCVIETRIMYDELSPDLTAEWPYLRDIVLALRLLKAGDVHVSCSFWLQENKIIGVNLPSSFDLLFSENPYFLKKEETASFEGLWKKVQKSKENKPYFEFPLTQFTKAFEERASGMSSDAIVDYIVAFESIVFYEEGRSIEPAGKVIGRAIGMLLGKNEKERKRIKKTLTEAYEIRNAKVHGNLKKLKKYQKAVNEVSISVENNLRCALRKFLEE